MLLALLPLAAFQVTSLPDSAALRRAVSEAQASFERTRRQHLPWTTVAPRCDVRVGRYCYWYDAHEPAPPAEPAAIRAARERLLQHLSAAAARLPGDGWVAGQRVRYLIEQGSDHDALAAARACRAAGWWCAALEGLVHQARQDYREAEQAYARSTAQMPDSIRCRWNDLLPLLEDRDAPRYRALSCAARDSANGAILWHARPLLAASGNDLATEILARQTYAAAMSGAVTHHGSRMDRDLAEVILRYGWPAAWSRRAERTAAGEAARVVGHEPRPALAVLAAATSDANGSGWWPEEPLARARYAPRHATALVPLAAVQWARFARRDSAVLVAGFALPAETPFSASVTATLAVQTDRDVVRAAALVTGQRGTATVTAAADWRVAALEALAERDRVWAVHRLVAPVRRPWPPPISDLLLTDGDSIEAASLSEAAARALPGTELSSPAGVRVGLYWELYEPRLAHQSATVRLEVIPAPPGLLGRIGRTLGLSRARPPIRLTWERSLSAGTEPVPYGVLLGLERLRPGRYTIAVEIESDAGLRWNSARTILIRDAGGA